MQELLLNLTSPDVLLSGAAQGSDYKFGKYAHEAGHAVIHWSFDGHRSKCPPQHIVQLTQNHLDDANKAVERANKTLKRRFPSSNPHVNKLLQRNYYQVRWAQAVYAVGTIDPLGLVEGGTGWATQMYMDRFLHLEDYFEDCNLYVFDQKALKWMFWRGKWSEIEMPPTPHGVYAGIGTREINEAGIAAIAAVYNQECFAPQHK